MKKTQVCCAVCVIPCLGRNLEYSWGIHLIWCIRCYQIVFCCVDPPPRYQSREDEQAELGTLMEDPQAEKNFDDICMLIFLYVSLRWYHDAVEHTRISHTVDVFILMLTSADCMIQTTRCSFILFLKLNVFFFSTSLDFLKQCVISCDHEIFVADVGNMVLTDLETVQVCPVRVLGGTDNVYGKAWGRDCNPWRFVVFFCCVFLELECKINEPWTLWLCSFFLFSIFHVDWKSKFLIPAVAGQFGFGSLPVLFTDDRALQEMST